MCGIALILSGFRIEEQLSASAPFDLQSPQQEKLSSSRPSVKDLCEALKRRGPDNLNTEVLNVHPLCRSSEPLYQEGRSWSENAEHPDSTASMFKLHATDLKRGSDRNHVKLELIGATLQLRGAHPVSQPLRDSRGNLLVYNGEVFGGLQVLPDENDTEVLMAALQSCCTCLCHASTSNQICPCFKSQGSIVHKTVPQILSCLRGPWALVFWQAESQVLWFGRDVLGRRSLLTHKPSRSDPRFLLSSVAPVKSLTIAEEQVADSQAFAYWEELPCGVHSLLLGIENGRKDTKESFFMGPFQLHEWQDPLLTKICAWERQFIDPNSIDGFTYDCNHIKKGNGAPVEDRGLQTASGRNIVKEDLDPMQNILEVLRQSVRKRTSNLRSYQQHSGTSSVQEPGGDDLWDTPVAILFSGGLDSMILAALADECLDPQYGIDLLNVSFDGSSAPDRISAVAGFDELQQVSPFRRWKLVEVDADFAAVNSNHSYLCSLICPSKTYMDLNIGAALWLAARGKGWVTDVHKVPRPRFDSHNGIVGRTAYTSKSRILLVGAGADEQCGGYGRHRTKFRQGGWEALQAEMRIDMHRIWKRNLGRDDRCMADVGKEVRFPFLDEDVVSALLDLPLWDIVDLQQPVGRGDKKILREVALSLGLKGASTLPKRAIQFGTRIAQESNKWEFGSNHAANQASAGAALLPGLMNAS